MPAAKEVAAKVANAASKAAKKAAATPARPPKLQPVSPTLRAFLGGIAEANRPMTLKHVWGYIKSHQLQDPNNGHEIICDEKLKLVLGKDRVNFTEVAALISPHFPKKEVTRKKEATPKKEDKKS